MPIGMSNSVMKIEYNDEDALISAKGIFSFSVYIDENEFNKGLTIHSYLIPNDFKKMSIIYFIGIASYLKMIEDNTKWAGWKVVIHTDFPSILGNPLAFDKFKKMGAIIGLTTLDKKYSDPKFKSVFRLNRFYPMFIKDLDCPIFIRDADTIFEGALGNIIIKNNPRDKKLNVSSDDLISSTFVSKLSNWEYMYYEKVNKFNNKVIFSYDDGYFLALNNSNDITKLDWIGDHPIPKNTNMKYLQSHYYYKARFLAGILSKMGKSLPEELWLKALPEYIEKSFSKLDTLHNSIRNNIIRSIDEAYLTNVIYKWCKEHNYVEFFKMNYVDAYTIFSLGKEYFINKYPNAFNSSTNKLNLVKLHKLFSEQENSNIKKENKEILNLFPINGLIRNNPKKWHIIKSKLTLNNPKIQLSNKHFVNPLNFKENPLKKPEYIPNYFFGGTKRRSTKRRHNHKRKTHKNRK